MDFWGLLTDIGILLGASVLLGGLFIRLGQSPIVGYLLAGLILGGPGSLFLVKAQTQIEAIAEIGVSLLLFSLGLEFSWNRIKAFNKSSIIGGVLQVILTPLIIFVACFFFGVGIKTSLVLGLVFTLSSTACVLRVLSEKGELDSFPGRNALSVLLVQDMAVVPFAIIIPLLASEENLVQTVNGVGFLLGSMALLVLGLYLLLNKIMVRFLGIFSLEQNRELAILVAVFTGIGSAWVSHRIGISPALGAFVAGMFLGGSPFSTQIRADVSPLKTVFLTLFFGAAGMVADPVWIFNNAFLVFSLSLAIILGKAIIITIIFSGLRQPFQYSLISGIFLGQIGEFAFVLLHLGNRFGLLQRETYLLAISSTIITLFFTPFLVKLAPKFVFHWNGRNNKKIKATPAWDKKHSEIAYASKVFVIGFGPAGVTVAKKLKELGRNPTVIDLNPNAHKIAQELSLEFILGDAQRYEVLEHAGFKLANLIILTVPSKSAAVNIIKLASQIAPAAKILVRSHYAAHKRELESLGPYVVVVDEEAVAISLAEASKDCL